MGREIFNLIGMAESIRYTEYKDIYSAISEIVDNSVEANAREVVIILNTYQVEGKEVVDKLAVIDNGHGMDKSILQDCLVFGSSTKKDRVMMGRFGVGLGQASLFAAPRVEVYSWQDNATPSYVYLDTELMRLGEQTEIPTPSEKDFPDYFKTYKSIKHYLPNKSSNIDFSSHGTMIVWNKIDKISGRVANFKAKLAEELGRKFRYYIAKGVNILITDTAYSFIEDVQPIDPMFLMVDSKILGDSSNTINITSDKISGEPIFEPFDNEETPNGEFVFNITIDKPHQKTIFGSVKIRSSVVKEKFYYGGNFFQANKRVPGDTDIGKMLKKYEHISILRAGREIQFDKFGLYDSMNTPTNRWWSLEIEFDPTLDEFFKLSNNKQKVEIITSHYFNYVDLNKRKIPKSFTNDDVESIEEKYWIEIVSKVKNLISLMNSRNKKVQFKYSQIDKQISKVDHKEENRAIYKSVPNLSQSESLLEKVVESKIQDNFAQKSRALSSELSGKIHNDIINQLKSDVTLDGLFHLTKQQNGSIVTSVNYDHQFFNLKQYINSEKLDEHILSIFLQALVKIKEKMITYESRKLFDDFIMQINKEIEVVLNSLLTMEE